MNIASHPATSTQSMAHGVRCWAVRMIAFLFIFGAFLFLVAGRISWTAGWVYLGMNTLTQLLRTPRGKPVASHLSSATASR